MSEVVRFPAPQKSTEDVEEQLREIGRKVFGIRYDASGKAINA